MANHYDQEPIDMMSMVDPYFYDRLCQFTGKQVAIQTPRGTLQGTLEQVTPDHVVLKVGGVNFYIRISEITWFTRAVESPRK